MGIETAALFTFMSTKNIQQQISKLQSQLDSKKKEKSVKHEKASSQQRRKSRSRSHTPKRGDHKVIRDQASTYSKFKAKGGFDGHLDFTRARDCVQKIRPLIEKKRELDKRLKNTIKENAMLGCVHKWVQSPEQTNSYHRLAIPARCVACGVKETEVDEKAPIKLKETDDLKSLYDMVCKEFDIARTTMRAGLGNRPIKMKLTMAFKLTTTVTSGVTNTVTCGGITTGIRIDQTNEFSNLSSLFDEVKVTGGYVDFLYENPVQVPNSSTGIGKLTTNMPCIAFDPTDATAALSVAALSEYAQHKYLSPLIYSTTSTPLSCPAEGMKHHFEWHLPKGFMEGATFAGDQWIDMADSTGFAFGMIKFYHVGVVTTATDTGSGIIHLMTEFRCRQ